MIKNVESLSLLDILPANILEDEKVAAAAQALDKEIQEVTKATIEVLHISRIDELPEAVVDLLAWQWHVDFYDQNLSLDKRRALVKNSIRWHMKKGTKAAVQELIQTVFESGVVSEWFDYGGEPYRFKVTTVDTMPSESEINRVIQAINSVKNARSHLDEIGFIRYLNTDLCVGGVPNLHKRITVSPAKPTDQTEAGMYYAAGAMSQHIRYEVSMEPPTNHEVQDIMYFGGGVSRHKKFTVALTTEQEE